MHSKVGSIEGLYFEIMLICATQGWTTPKYNPRSVQCRIAKQNAYNGKLENVTYDLLGIEYLEAVIENRLNLLAWLKPDGHLGTVATGRW